MEALNFRKSKTTEMRKEQPASDVRTSYISSHIVEECSDNQKCEIPTDPAM